jgi:Na+/proline symporter
MSDSVESGSSAVLWTFGAYMVAVFFLAWLAGRVKEEKKEGFMSDYFLGSRGFGVWALALTAAATSASGGSFMGFPALIYTHGWVLALWIAGYMTVPLVAMALMGKRLNQVARRAGAITIPEILGKRFDSAKVGATATIMIVLFLFCYLLAQFKAGSKILSVLLEDSPIYRSAVGGVASVIEKIPWVGQAEPDYVLCLVVFGIAVVAYVSYGGFRAVVWTDVMQGIVMGLGVVILLVLAISQVGGLANASRQVAAMTPPEFASGWVELPDGATAEEEHVLPKGTWLNGTEDGEVLRLAERTVIPTGKKAGEPTEFLIMKDAGSESAEIEAFDIVEGYSVAIKERMPYENGAGETGVYSRPPGPNRDNALGYLTVAMAFCWFAFWPFGGVGQPHNMVRMMIFDKTQVLRRALVTLALYFGFIYLSLVIIFVCARVLLPGMEIDPDRVMPEFAKAVTSNAGFPWLAGLVVAAPFAAVMSSVDSFLLVVSSSVVRDLYQKHINPEAPESRLRKLSYAVTAVVGSLAVLIALNPPEYLQDLIVFASEGLAACFLMPMILGLFWQRMTANGALYGMLAGALMQALIYVIGYYVNGKFGSYNMAGLMPFFWDVAASTIACVAGSLLSAPPSRELVHKFFARRDQ